MRRNPEVAVNLDNGVVEALVKEIAVAKTFPRLRDKKEALEDLTVEARSITDFPKILEFDPQSLEGLSPSKQHSIVNWELNILTAWLTGNQPVAFEFQGIVMSLLSNTGINQTLDRIQE